MAYRIILWGAGRNGQALIRAVARHPDLALVGCRVWSAEKEGVDAGILAGIAPLGVPATRDAAALIARNADLVLFCPNHRPDNQDSDDELCALLRSGKNVISVTGRHSMPGAAPDGYGAQFEDACRAGGATLAAAGVNPGFIAERLAPLVTGFCADVESVSVGETYLCANSTRDIVFDTMGFGMPLGKWTTESPVAGMFNHMFSQLVHNLARSLDVALTGVRWTASVAPAHRDVALAAGLVRQGTVGAITQRWEGIARDPDQIRIAKHVCWVIADDIPGFPVASGWRIDIAGKPSIRTVLTVEPDADGRTWPGEAMVGSAIPMIDAVIKAPPGFLLPTTFAPFRRRFPDAG